MAIARVQISTPATSTGTGSVAPSWPVATTAGNLLIAVFGGKVTSDTLVIPGDWLDAEIGTVQQRNHVYYIPNAAARSGAETFHWTTDTTDCYAVLAEYSGVATSTPLDVHTGSSASSNTPSTDTTGTTAQADTLVFASLINANTATTSAEAQGGTVTGGTLVELAEATSANATNGNKVTGRVWEQIVTAQGTAEVHATLAASRAWNSRIVTFKAAAAAAGQTEFVGTIPIS